MSGVAGTRPVSSIRTTPFDPVTLGPMAGPMTAVGSIVTSSSPAPSPRTKPQAACSASVFERP